MKNGIPSSGATPETACPRDRMSFCRLCQPRQARKMAWNAAILGPAEGERGNRRPPHRLSLRGMAAFRSSLSGRRRAEKIGITAHAVPLVCQSCPGIRRRSARPPRPQRASVAPPILSPLPIGTDANVGSMGRSSCVRAHRHFRGLESPPGLSFLIECGAWHEEHP